MKLLIQFNYNVERVGLMLFIGIDISKLTFDVAYLLKGKYVNTQFTNDLAGFHAFEKKLNNQSLEPIICLEATGVYSFGLATFLAEKAFKVIVVNPVSTHAFSRMELSRNKTDKADAQLIARYCEHLFSTGDSNKLLYVPKSPDYDALQRLVTRLEQLEKSKAQENNRLEASCNKDTTRSMKRFIRFIKTEIKATKTTITKLVIANEELTIQVNLLTSISGIGDRTAWSILAYIGDISFFDNAKQVACYAGLTPKISQSGTSVNKSSVSKLGHKRLRKSLYMPALVAIRHNPLMKQFYTRLVNKGKAKKVAIIAVMRKLLVIAYGVLKSKQPFDLEYGF